MAISSPEDGEWIKEVVRISDFIESKHGLLLEYIRVAVSALREQQVDAETCKDFYQLHELIKQKVTLKYTPFVVYYILQSISYPKASLERIKQNHTFTDYEIWRHFSFDLTLVLISILSKMPHRNYALYKEQITNSLLANRLHHSKITSRANLIQCLIDYDALVEGNIPTFLSVLYEVNCHSLRRPLIKFCRRHGLTLPEESDYSYIGFNDPRRKKCCICGSILAIMIVVFSLLFAAGLGLYIGYNNNMNLSDVTYTITMYDIGGFIKSPVCYDAFKVKEILINATTLTHRPYVYIVPFNEIRYYLLTMSETRIAKFKTYIDTTLDVSGRIALLSHEQPGMVKYRFKLIYDRHEVHGCPAQLYLFDSYTDFFNFNSLDAYPKQDGSIKWVNTSGCLNNTDWRNVTFPLKANVMYYVGFYIAKNVDKVLCMAFELMKINKTGLSEVCNTASTCTVSLTGLSSLPSGHSNVCVLISSTSSGSVTLSPILATWNVYNVSGVAGFPVFLLIACVLMVVLLILCIRHCCCYVMCTYAKRTLQREREYSLIN